ncbi:MAG: hypothetical protein DRQ44_16615 [Gammaproteobacteria bacterium]|nr:MAG: hypothetical protein DRQ44_16615 [Gammaproteobacteria bacterium]
MQTENHLKDTFKKTIRTFINVLPIIIGMILATSLVITMFPEQVSSGLFGNGEIIDTLLGASIGSIAAGHPLASYLVGGELLGGGVSLIAVTALVVTWVTVGIVQLPAEALMLGTRFAVYRNIVSFIAAIAIAFLTVYTLQFLGLAWPALNV